MLINLPDNRAPFIHLHHHPSELFSQPTIKHRQMTDEQLPPLFGRDDDSSDAPNERDVIKCAFSTAHPFTPKGWQVDVGSKLLSASCDTTRAGPIPILLVRPTGGGKSAVRDAVGLCLGGVILTICPLLSLAADQVDKLKPLANREANVDVFNVDAIQNSRRNRELQQDLLSYECHHRFLLQRNRLATVVLAALK